MKKKYPIILDPPTRVVVDFLFKQFGLLIQKDEHLFLCQKEIGEIDKDVLIKNHGDHYDSEHFICCFSLDREKGITATIPPQELKQLLYQKSWPYPEESEERKIKDFMSECEIQPDFIITYGRLEMPSGISDMCWCIHELLQDDDTGIFDGIKSVPDVVKMFTDYIWYLPGLGSISPEKVKKSCKDEILDEDADADLDPGEAFKMEDMIIRVLDRVPFETQKRLFKCFCGKKPEFGRHLTELEVWDSKRLRTYMLKYDVLNHFEKYREIIAEEMTLMMPNEGYIEPSDDDE